MTKKEMINKIYEVVADKTLSMWCILSADVEYENSRDPDARVKLVSLYEDLTVVMYWNDRIGITNYKIIWHPVMINRVDWYFKSNNRQDLCISLDIEDLLKPIEERPEGCIKFIY